MSPNMCKFLTVTPSSDPYTSLVTPLSPDALNSLITPLSCHARNSLGIPLLPDARSSLGIPLSPVACSGLGIPLSPDARSSHAIPLSRDARSSVGIPLSLDVRCSHVVIFITPNLRRSPHALPLVARSAATYSTDARAHSAAHPSCRTRLAAPTASPRSSRAPPSRTSVAQKLCGLRLRLVLAIAHVGDGC